MPSRSLLLLLAAFAVSVAVRVPLLDRPLSAHHELCTALVLTVLHIWQVDGYTAHHGVPPISFTGPADRYPAGWTDSPALHDGVLYYLSHPPLAYDLPQLLFYSLGMAPNALGLQLFNLLFHLVAALCLFRALLEVMPLGPGRRAALAAAVLYLFMPAPLWFHGNVYMSDMFVQNFWLMHVAVAMRLFGRGAAPAAGTLALFGATLFLTVYTSWLGVFAAAAAVLIALWCHTRLSVPGMWRVIGVALAAVAAALLLTAWRYLQLIDADMLLAYFLSRFEVRGSVGMAEGAGHYLRQLLVNYRTGYLPVIGLLALLSLMSLRRTDHSALRSATVQLFVLLSGLPVLFDHLFLLQYAHHDFAALKAGPLLCGLAGIGLAQLPPMRAVLAVVLVSLAGVLYFHRLNPMPDSEDGRLAQERVWGLAMAAAVSPDQPLFFQGHTPEPQVAWYAKRTIFRIDELSQARAFLVQQGFDSGVVFSLEDGVLQHQVVHQ